MPCSCRTRLSAACALAAVFCTTTAGAQSTADRCLLSALQRAADDATVESVRRQCEALPRTEAQPDSQPGTRPTPRSEAGAQPQLQWQSQPPSQWPSQDSQPPALGSSAPASPVPPSPATAAAAAAPAASDDSSFSPPLSPVARRLALEQEVWSKRFALLPHRPNYIDPFSHALETPASAAPDAHLQRNEIKFQISFKLALTPPLFGERASLFFAYTGQSWWQAYNRDRSSPFREYSHEPELYASWKPQRSVLGWDWRLASAGFVHQSNGRSGESSRSWNRLFADLRFDRPNGWWIGVRPWWRIPESGKPYPGAPEGDDNPDIERFVGDGELRTGYVGEVHNFTVTMRRSFARAGKGAVQLDWSRPTGFSPDLRWHVQYFDGYGESMLDYQTRVRRIGFGVMLNDWY